MRNNWPIHCLTDVVTLPTGQVDPNVDPYRSQILLAPDHVEQATGRILKYETAEEQGATSGKYVVRPGDIVFSKIRPALRKVALADFSGICSADMYPLRPSEKILGSFLLPILLSGRFSRYVESLSGRTGIPKVNREDLSGFFFPLPPLEEQRRIVEVIDAVSRQEEAVRASIAKLSSISSATVDSLLERVVWDYTLSDAIDGPIRNGHSPIESEAWTGVRMLGLGCLTPYGFNPIQLKNAPSSVTADHVATLREGDLLISRANTRELVGLAGIYRDVGTPCIYPDLMMRIRPSNRCSTEFLGAVLMSTRVRRHVRALAQGTSESMVKISAATVYGIPIPLPEFEEQNHLLRVLDSFSTQIRDKNAELGKLGSVKQGIVDDLLSGRVSV
ncbi:restriction endonuclease subunit S [Streptosporangium sp. G12]